MLAAIAPVLHGCSDVKCADGLFRMGNDCVPYDPNDTSAPTTTANPPGGPTRDAIPPFVTLTSNKPATIYFTTDGSDPDPTMQTGQQSPAIATGIAQGTTLKFFAIDAAGHRETTNAATYEQDITPPGPVTNLAVSVTNAQATISWTNPTDAHFTGVVVARVADLLDAEPTPGTGYTAPASLTTSVQIVYVGNGTQFDDPGLAMGSVRYAVWSNDDLFNYSVPVTATADVGLLGTTATYTFNTTNNTLTLVAAPTAISLTGTTAAYAGTTVTLNLSLKNVTNKYFQNPKTLVTGVTGGAFSAPDGTAGGFPFRNLGPAFLAPNATVTKVLAFTGVAAGTTATINLALGHDPSFVGAGTHPGGGGSQHAFIDSASGLGFTNATSTSVGPRNRVGGTIRPGALVAGHFLDVPTTHATIERWDLTTLTQVGAGFVAEADRANVMQLISVGGREIAILKVGGRRRSGAISIVRMDEGLHISARLDLDASQGQGLTQSAISPDGVVLAVPVTGGIALVDTIQMTQIDADPSTPTIDIIPVPVSTRIRSVAFFNGSSGLAAIAFQGGDVGIATADGSGGWKVTISNLGNVRGNAVALAPDGHVWFATDNNVSIFDPASGAITTSIYNNGARALAVMDGQMWVLRSNQTSVDLVALTGAIQRTLTLPAQIFGHWLQGTDPP